MTSSPEPERSADGPPAGGPAGVTEGNQRARPSRTRPLDVWTPRCRQFSIGQTTTCAQALMDVQGRPFRAPSTIAHGFPGRCPGLSHVGPLGLVRWAVALGCCVGLLRWAVALGCCVGRGLFRWAWAVPLGVGRSVGRGPFTLAWAVPLGVVRSVGRGPFRWAWSVRLGVVRSVGHGAFRWAWSVPLGLTRWAGGGGRDLRR
jgi:hypothetical protein